MSGGTPELRRELKQLIVRTLRLEGLEPESIADDQALFAGGLGLDSVDALELVVALESAYGVSVPSAEVGSTAFATIAGLADWLAGHGAGSRSTESSGRAPNRAAG